MAVFDVVIIIIIIIIKCTFI